MQKCWTCKEDKNSCDFHKSNKRCKQCYSNWYRKNRFRICPECRSKYNGRGDFCCNMCKLMFMHSKKRNGCWEWNGPVAKHGYALTKDYENRGKNIPVHRLSYRIHKGNIPVGLLVCHTCDNRKCINPDHLWVGTHQDNSNDCKSKKRAKSGGVYGVKCTKAKLNDEKVKEIKKMLKNGISNKDIAEIFGISRPVISEIKHNKLWKHVI